MATEDEKFADKIIREYKGNLAEAGKAVADLARGKNPPPGTADILDVIAKRADEAGQQELAKQMRKDADKARGLNANYGVQI